jgi:hypothetical protein
MQQSTHRLDTKITTRMLEGKELGCVMGGYDKFSAAFGVNKQLFSTLEKLIIRKVVVIRPMLQKPRDMCTAFLFVGPCVVRGVQLVFAISPTTTQTCNCASCNLSGLQLSVLLSFYSVIIP